MENISSQCPDHCWSDVALARLFFCRIWSLRAAFGVCVLLSEMIDRQRLISKKRWYSIELMPPRLKTTAGFLLAISPARKKITINSPRESSARAKYARNSMYIYIYISIIEYQGRVSSGDPSPRKPPDWILDSIWIPWEWILKNVWTPFSFQNNTEACLSLQSCICFLCDIQMRWVWMLLTFRRFFFQTCVTPNQRVDYSFFPRRVPIDSAIP